MKRSLLTLLLVLSIASISGCDSSSTLDTVQIINEMQWLPDGNSLLAVAVTVSTDLTTGGTSYLAGLYRVRADGSLGDRFNIPDKGLPQGYPTPINISKDGRSAVTELGTTVYRVDLSSGGVTALIRNEYFLGASSTLKYALVTETSSSLYTRFAMLYDISGSTPRKIKDFTINGIKGMRAIWLGDTAFAISGVDSTGADETEIYDTACRITTHIKNSKIDGYGYISPSYYFKKLGAYAADAGAFFLYDATTQGLMRYDLASGAMKTVLSNDTIEMVAATPSGNLVAYSSGSGKSPFTLFALNPATGNYATIATNAFEVELNPQGNRVAYSSVENGVLGAHIHVLPVSVP
jgi:hypothetical protein